MAVAGCGSHQVRVVDRGGGIVATGSVLTEVEWSRVLDDVSTARVVINPDGDCCGPLGNVRSWRHRLVIYRDDRYVWDGPITNVDWGVDSVEIFAEDVLSWLANRVVHQNLSFKNTDLNTIAAELIADGFFPDDPGHDVEVVAAAGVTGSRAYTRNVGQTLDHIKDLAEAGLDFTAIGSTILLLPETWRERVGRLTDADFPDGLKVSEDGKGLVTRVVVAGQEQTAADGTVTDTVIGEAGGVDDYYGLHERYVSQSSITDTASATAAAQAIQRSGLTVPVFVDTQEVTISPDTALDVSSLVPGWCLDVTSTATCRTVAQRLKIVGLKVTETGGSETAPGGESVQVQVAASGAEAA